MNTNRIVLVLILLAAYPAVGDTLVTKDGRVFEGRVVRQEEDQVVFEVQKYGAYMQVSLESKDVASVKTGASSKPRSSDVYRVPTSQPSTQPSSQPSSQPEATKYYVIEIRGEIGKDVQKESLQLALKDARAKKADCVVFHIDSPGGSVTETEAIVDLMGEVHGQKRIALVAKALSSAAVITMACTATGINNAITRHIGNRNALIVALLAKRSGEKKDSKKRRFQ